jgi:6-phosphofructokinase 2
MILTITLNPCVDKSTTVDQLTPDNKLRCSAIMYEPGGGGINVSKALLKLQQPSTALFTKGGHNGNMLCSLLDAQSIKYHAVETTVETRENWTVTENEPSNQYRFTFPGLPVEEEAIKTLVNELGNFSASYIVASGSLPIGLPNYFYGLIAEKANSIGAKCIIDTSGPALSALKGKGAYLIKPNISELCKLLNVATLENNEVDDAAQQLILDGYASLIAVSMGPTGAWLVSKDEKHFIAAPKVHKKSTVGAGDSMVAGLTYKLQQNKPLHECIAFGVACGSAATMNAGTELFKPNDVETLFKQLVG